MCQKRETDDLQAQSEWVAAQMSHKEAWKSTAEIADGKLGLGETHGCEN